MPNKPSPHQLNPTSQPKKKRTPRPRSPRNTVFGEGQRNVEGHTVRLERVDADGKLVRRVLERPPGGSPFSPQIKINAFNLPFTGNPGSGCLFNCSYCFLRQNFFARHVTADHGQEMNYLPDMAAAAEKFLKSKAVLPQYMKRVQMGVSTEMFMPAVVPFTRPDEVLRTFQRHGRDWMVHLVTKSPEILKYADLIAEMKDQVQVEVSLVTLDEQASRIFEQGTPSVAQRLKIIETLAGKGVFVRMMLMPAMREYELRLVGAAREIVFKNTTTGDKRPGRKRSGQVDGNFAAGEVALELHDGRRWVPAEEPKSWHPVVLRDWSELPTAQANWRNYGAQAYKQKDLNYFHVDELIAAHREGRPPKEERGRSEDPSAEMLIHSGETVRDRGGADRFSEVEAWHLPRKEWGEGNPTRPPLIHRRVMDFGYAKHSAIDWIDCI